MQIQTLAIPHLMNRAASKQLVRVCQGKPDTVMMLKSMATMASKATTASRAMLTVASREAIMANRAVMTKSMLSKAAVIAMLANQKAMRTSRISKAVMKMSLISKELLRMYLISRMATAMELVLCPMLSQSAKVAMSTVRIARTQGLQAGLEGRACKHKGKALGGASIRGLVKVSVVTQMAHSLTRALQFRKKLGQTLQVETLIW